MNQLIIVEGLPGSGKTTFAKMIHKKLSSYSSDVQIFVEGDLHPADMAWCACLTSDQFIELCNNYPAYVNAFNENKTEWNDYVILAYTKIENMDEKLYNFLEQHEVYDGRVGKKLFCELHKSRWTNFGEVATDITIFECALLQNHINELLLFHCEEEEKIFQYIKELLDTVAKLNPIIVYLDFDYEVAIKRATEERIDGNGNRVWERLVSEYISNSPYGKKHGLTGSLGMYHYLKKRKELELDILKWLPIETHIIPMNVENQNEMEEQFIEKYTKKNL